MAIVLGSIAVLDIWNLYSNYLFKNKTNKQKLQTVNQDYMDWWFLTQTLCAGEENP